MDNKILVVGGTGTVGRSLVGLLKNADADFKVLARTAEKAQQLGQQGVRTVMGELGKWPGVKAALKEVDTVFLLTNSSFDKVAMQNGLLDLAKAMGVRKVVKLSAVNAQPGAEVHLFDWHGQIEDHLANSGLVYINIRPHTFMQNMLMHLPTIKADNCFYESMGDAKVPMIDARDIARAAYECLVRDDLNNKTYTITGPEAVSYQDMAEAISKAAKRDIRYVNIPTAAHNQALKAAGLPEWMADDLTLMSSQWGGVAVNEPTEDFKTITKAKQFDIHQFATDHSALFR